ncbi:signal-transduction protein [Vibrio ishigakensis]|uniref:Signal-transduction protein n=2 Tax=Vibrio ishigakensis TaxID=1481914 RepID=A0A0B8NSN1_9VIBR|nr:signal-transduction protein [Vibrio ishigakensis]
MPEQFNTQHPPFDKLDSEQTKVLLDSLDIAYFRQGDAILDIGEQSDSLFVLIKGAVEQRTSDRVIAHFGHDDLFDADALFNGKARHQFLAIEDVLCYLVPKPVFLNLCENNQEFEHYFNGNLSQRKQLLRSAQKQQNLAEFILSRVNSDIYHPPLILESSTSLQNATAKMNELDIDAALVRLDEEDNRLEANPEHPPYAIVTRTNLLHALALEGKQLQDEVSGISSFPVFQTQEGEFLFSAMLTMTRNKMKRLMVVHEHEAVGMLDLTQILSAFSSHSHVISLSIARANTIEDLTAVSERQNDFIKSLLSNGIRTRFIMELISVVNEQIIQKAFEITVPEEHQNSCSLLVLGSEGRGEQVFKTDQDNALILSDDNPWPEHAKSMQAFSDNLMALGYPPCPGQVMVNNPKWVNSQSQWIERINSWTQSIDAESVMQLSIFADAHPVAGNHALITRIIEHLQLKLQGNMLLLSDFVRPALQFGVPLTLFGNVKSNKEGIDIKKGGIFPIVHGVRTLALENGIVERNTFERIAELGKRGR